MSGRMRRIWLALVGGWQQRAEHQRNANRALLMAATILRRGHNYILVNASTNPSLLGHKCALSKHILSVYTQGNLASNYTRQ